MSADLSIPPETEQAMQDAARDASIAAAKAFGFGGANWTITRYTGDGVTEGRTPGSADQITGYAYRQRPGSVGPALPGSPVLDDIWRMIVISGDIQQGDVLTSVADGRKITVESVEPWYDYRRCELERQR